MKIKRILVLALGYLIVGGACAITLKAAIGVGAWEALAQTIYDITGLEIGTCGIILNFCCIGIQMLALKKDFKMIQLLQVPLNIILGVVTNLVLYNTLHVITIDSYWINVIIFILGYIVCAVSIGAIMALDIVTFSLEGACEAIARVSGKRLSMIRQGVDIIVIIICLGLSFSLDLPLAIREGTIIGMLIFGPILGISMKRWKPILKKYNLIDSLDKGEVYET